MEEELRLLDMPFKHGFIKYYDKDTSSKSLTIFDKPIEFENQKEFRFFVDNYTLKPIKLQLGSLKDYAEIYTVNENLRNYSK